jgi:hypothetical protein
MKTEGDIKNIIEKIISQRINHRWFQDDNFFPFIGLGCYYKSDEYQILIVKTINKESQDFDFTINITEFDEEFFITKESNYFLWNRIDHLYDYLYIKYLMYGNNYVISDNKIAFAKKKRKKNKKQLIQEYNHSIVI